MQNAVFDKTRLSLNCFIRTCCNAKQAKQSFWAAIYTFPLKAVWICWPTFHVGYAAHRWFISYLFFIQPSGWTWKICQIPSSTHSRRIGKSLPLSYCIVTAGRLPRRQNTLINAVSYSIVDRAACMSQDSCTEADRHRCPACLTCSVDLLLS